MLVNDTYIITFYWFFLGYSIICAITLTQPRQHWKLIHVRNNHNSKSSDLMTVNPLRLKKAISKSNSNLYGQKAIENEWNVQSTTAWVHLDGCHGLQSRINLLTYSMSYFDKRESIQYFSKLFAGQSQASMGIVYTTYKRCEFTIQRGYWMH